MKWRKGFIVVILLLKLHIKEIPEGVFVGHLCISGRVSLDRLNISQWLLHILRVDWNGKKPDAKKYIPESCSGKFLSVGYGAY